MAASLNKVFLMGNLTRDPELRYIPSGAAVANFTVAVNRSYKDSAGGRKEEASFIRVVIWGKMAEVCGEYLSKGRAVLVEGRIRTRTWEGQDGQKRNATEVVATNVQFLGSRGERKETTVGPQENLESINLEEYDNASEGADTGKETPEEEIPF